MKRYATTVLLLVTACGSEPGPTIINGRYEAESLCREYEGPYCEARTRCGEPIPQCNLNCTQYAGNLITLVTIEEMEQCVTDLDFLSCSSLQPDYVPFSCNEVDDAIKSL